MTSFMEELAAIDSSVVILLFYIAAAYFAGSFSPSIMLGKLNGIDIRTKGSGNAGTTNVLRTLGKKAAAITLAVDVCKGFAAVFLAKMLFGAAFALLCGIAVICGHIWPAVHGFRGGKGVATGLGVLLAFNAVIGGLALAVAAAVMLVTKRVSVGALTAAAAFPAMVFWMEPVYFAPALAIAVVVWIKHRQNLVRLVRGEEPKIRFKP